MANMIIKERERFAPRILRAEQAELLLALITFERSSDDDAMVTELSLLYMLSHFLQVI